MYREKHVRCMHDWNNFSKYTTKNNKIESHIYFMKEPLPVGWFFEVASSAYCHELPKKFDQKPEELWVRKLGIPKEFLLVQALAYMSS